MEDLYIKSIPILDEFLERDIKKISKIKLKKVDHNLYHFKLDFREVFEVVYELINLSRTIDKIYMKQISTTIGEYNFYKDTIKVDEKSIDVYDLSGNILNNRNYLIHSDTDSLNQNIIINCLFELGIDKLKSYSIIDPFSNYSEILIEAASFNPRKPLYVKERYEYQLYKEFKGTVKRFPNIPVPKDKNKFVSIVDSDKKFKRSRETNLNQHLRLKHQKFL